MNKKNIFIAVISLMVLSFVMIQCTKENTNELENNSSVNQKIELRSQAPENVINPPINCGPEDYDEDIVCFPGLDTTMIIQSDEGCEVALTMYVEVCHNKESGDLYVNFSNYRWRPLFPLSSECLDIMTVKSTGGKSIGDFNDDLDDFNQRIVDKFQERFMTDWVLENSISCDLDNNYVTSLYFKAVCQQRCVTPPSVVDGAPFYFIDNPCATDGCCVDLGYYCVQSDGTVYQSKGTETIAPCTDFYSVDCGDLIPYGGCRDLGCGN